jgi:ribose 5-phosphate isomerase B
MAIYIGSDHAGFELKEQLKAHLERGGYRLGDMGAFTMDPEDDYPDVAARLARRVATEGSAGILLCGSGAGVCIAANKIPGVRAVLASDPDVAQSSRQDDHTNILCLPARFVDIEAAVRIVTAWLDASYQDEERFFRRLDKITRLERVVQARREIIPAILAHSREEFVTQLERVQDVTDMVHIDVMDGQFVPNTTIGIEDMPLSHLPLRFSAHLMVEKPHESIALCKDFGFSQVIVHAESGPVTDMRETLQAIARANMGPALAINPATSVAEVEALFPLCDMIVVMGVKPGFSGQSFQQETLKKIEQIREQAPYVILAADGGVTFENASLLLERGVTRLISASSVFTGDAVANMRRFRQVISAQEVL